MSVGIGLLVLGAVEVLGRYAGFTPSNESPLESWAQIREKVEQNKQSAIVVVGASRAVAGIDPEVIRRESRGKPPVFQLSRWGSSPLYILKDLIEDSQFGGTVIVTFAPSVFLVLNSSQTKETKKYIKYWRDQYHIPSKRTERWLRSFFEPFTFGLHNLHPARIAKRLLLKQELPKPFGFYTRRDRMRYVRPSQNNPTDFETCGDLGLSEDESIETKVKREQEFNQLLGDLKILERRLKANGGRLIFVRMPSEGNFRRLENILFPRARYWDKFGQAGFETIHFEDYPDLQVPTMDCSHLDGVAAGEFSSALVRLLEQGQSAGAEHK